MLYTPKPRAERLCRALQVLRALLVTRVYKALLVRKGPPELPDQPVLRALQALPDHKATRAYRVIPALRVLQVPLARKVYQVWQALPALPETPA
jgi:hypothetical protein